MRQDKEQTGPRTSLSVPFYCSIIIAVIVLLFADCLPQLECKLLESRGQERGLFYSLTHL